MFVIPLLPDKRDKTALFRLSVNNYLRLFTSSIESLAVAISRSFSERAAIALSSSALYGRASTKYFVNILISNMLLLEKESQMNYGRNGSW